MFYLAAEPKFIERELAFSEFTPDEKLLKSYKLEGYTVGTEADILSMDQNISGYSTVIPAQQTKDGTVKSSKLLSDDEYSGVEQFAIDKAKEFSDEILEGHYPICPKGDERRNSCTYCDFRSVCRFDSAYMSITPDEKASDNELFKREEDN